jgi:voltage-gated potassium channel
MVAFIMIFSVMILVSMLMYIAEKNVQPDKFGSIPKAMYFVTITLSTVGKLNFNF